MGDLSRDFSAAEFACPCCGLRRVSADLVAGLQQLRTLARAPVRVTSGRRCRVHNAAVGGARSSLHVPGEAADVVVAGLTVREMYDLAVRVPLFGGIGVYPENGFIHVDVRRARARWARVGGQYVGLHEAAGFEGEW